jgi:ceramide glucosyltransferase
VIVDGDVIGRIAAAFWCVSITLLLLSVVAALVQPWLAERRARRTDQPPVSIVLPVKSLEDGFDETQESVFAQNYPHIDVTAAAQETSSPALDHIRAIFARHPDVSTRILQSTAKFAASPKVDNLHAPFTLAANDTILMKDANVWLEPDALSEHIRQLNDTVGLVCGIPYCDRLDSFAAQVEAAIINNSHARMLYLASALGQGHGVGKIMLFRRSDFERAGGFSAIDHTVGEDNAMAKALERIGKKAVFSHRPVRQILGRRSFVDVYQRQLRWSVIRRKEELLSFLAEPICQALPALVAAGLAASRAGTSPATAIAATFGLWLGAETLLSVAKGWQLSPAAPVVLLVREALVVAVWVNAWMAEEVVWANGRVRVHARPPAAPEQEG